MIKKAEEEEEDSPRQYTDLSEKDEQQSSQNKQCGFSDPKKTPGHISSYSHLLPMHTKSICPPSTKHATRSTGPKKPPTNKQTNRHGSISICSHLTWPNHTDAKNTNSLSISAQHSLSWAWLFRVSSPPWT